MTTNSKNLREYADSARRAYSAACYAHVIDLDMYLVERRMYLAEYKLALTEAYGAWALLGTLALSACRCYTRSTQGSHCHQCNGRWGGAPTDN